MKADLIKEIREGGHFKTDKEADHAIDEVTAAIHRMMLKGVDVRLTGFGTFKQVRHEARTGRNPSSGETIQIAAKKTVKFTPSSTMKDDLNKPSKKA